MLILLILISKDERSILLQAATPSLIVFGGDPSLPSASGPLGAPSVVFYIRFQFVFFLFVGLASETLTLLFFHNLC